MERQRKGCKAVKLAPSSKFVGGCEFVDCGKEEIKCIGDPERDERIEKKCVGEGKEDVQKFDSNGCGYLICGTKDQCDKDVPVAAKKSCEERGGEFYSTADSDGCIDFVKCIEPGKRIDEIEVEPVKKIPSPTDVLDIVLKMEEVKISLDELAGRVDGLADYYESTDRKGEAEKFRIVADMFRTAKDKIDEVKEKLKSKLSTLTLDELTDIKKDLIVLKDSLLQEVINLLLSGKVRIEEITELKDCGQDGSCFEERFRKCLPTTFNPSPSTEETMVINLEGLKDGKCTMTASIKARDGEYDMKCELENYALGIHGPEDILPHCTGSMIDKIRSASSTA